MKKKRIKAFTLIEMKDSKTLYLQKNKEFI